MQPGPKQALRIPPMVEERARHALPGPHRPSAASLLLADTTAQANGCVTAPPPAPSTPNGSACDAGALSAAPREASELLADVSLDYLSDVAETTAFMSADAARRDRHGAPLVSTSPHVTRGPDAPLPPTPRTPPLQDCLSDAYFPADSLPGSLSCPMSPPDVFREPASHPLTATDDDDDDSMGYGMEGAAAGDLALSAGSGSLLARRSTPIDVRNPAGLHLRGSPMRVSRRSSFAADLDPLSRAAREAYKAEQMHSHSSSALLGFGEEGASQCCGTGREDAGYTSKCCSAPIIAKPFSDRHPSTLASPVEILSLDSPLQ